MKIPGSFYKVSDGEWIQPVRQGYLQKCCHCGLVHEIQFRIIKYGKNRTKLQLRAWRLNNGKAR